MDHRVPSSGVVRGREPFYSHASSVHHAFEEDIPLLDTDPGAVRAKAYDIVLNGNEIGGGSVRIHQNDVQEKMFEALGFEKEQAYKQFGFLLDAFNTEFRRTQDWLTALTVWSCSWLRRNPSVKLSHSRR